MSGFYRHARPATLHVRGGRQGRSLGDSIRALGLKVPRSPFVSSKANAICERLIGTI
jgi:hypothetical protein